MSEQEPNDKTPKITDKAQLEFMAGFEKIRKKSISIRQKNNELADLMATSSFVHQLFIVVWRNNSNVGELFIELRSLTFSKRLKSKIFPPVQKSGICDYMFKTIRSNWITVSKRHRRCYRIPPISDFPSIDEVTLSSAVRLDEVDPEIRVPIGPGVYLNISKTMLHDAVATLAMVDLVGGACLKLKLDGIGEKEISTLLGLSPYETRGHVRHAQQELRVILVRKLGE